MRHTRGRQNIILVLRQLMALSYNGSHLLSALTDSLTLTSYYTQPTIASATLHPILHLAKLLLVFILAEGTRLMATCHWLAFCCGLLKSIIITIIMNAIFHDIKLDNYKVTLQFHMWKWQVSQSIYGRVCTNVASYSDNVGTLCLIMSYVNPLIKL